MPAQRVTRTETEVLDHDGGVLTFRVYRRQGIASALEVLTSEGTELLRIYRPADMKALKPALAEFVQPARAGVAMIGATAWLERFTAMTDGVLWTEA